MLNDVPDEDRDHPHHRGLWFSHGKVNGVDFWAEDSKAGKIVHDKFIETKSGQDEGVIKSTCKWIAPDGNVTCTDERTFRVYNRPANERPAAESPGQFHVSLDLLGYGESQARH